LNFATEKLHQNLVSAQLTIFELGQIVDISAVLSAGSAKRRRGERTEFEN
jgi:hypothetical protein